MSEKKKSEVRRVNDAIESNKEAEKMVRQVIGKGEKISNEGKHVLEGYFENTRGLNNMLQEKLSEPVVMANKLTKVIRDKKVKCQSIIYLRMIWKVILSSDIEMCSSDDHSNEQRKTKKDSGRGSYKKNLNVRSVGRKQLH